MTLFRRFALVALAATALARAAAGQTFATNDSVLRRIWTLGMDSSRTYPLAQPLLDSIGPRLTGTPQQKSGNDWLVRTYRSWGIDARNETYGSWRGWRRGITHVDLVAPRVRTLEATMLAWSPGTKGAISAPAITLPDLADGAAFARWLPNVKGKYVLVSMPQPTCRPDTTWASWATAESYTRMRDERTRASAAWAQRVARTAGPSDSTPALATRNLAVKLEKAGASGVIINNWSQGWGVDKVFNARTTTVPTLDLSCEDYGLVFRLAEHGQGPVLRVEAESQALGEVPVYNTIAEIRGSEKPDEYVMLSAHFDSWDAGSGATDNGTGTVTMLEAMRILKQVYPHPRRTIIVGHWSGEEQGLVGSRAFAADHPEIVKGMQALFNQDNGTGRIVNISPSGLVNAGGLYANWLARIPTEISRQFNISFPGSPAGGGSDNASFICYGAPAFGLGSTSFDYGVYTWHTNRDTFDKIVWDDLKSNATLVAMLAYLASEDPQTVPRDRRVMGVGPAGPGALGEWPACQTPPRKSSDWTR